MLKLRGYYLAVFVLCLVCSPGALAQDAGSAGSYYHFSLAKMYHLNEQFNRAISEFEKALENDPESAVLHSEFAKTLLETQQISRAVEECEKAIALDPENVESHLLLGRIYRQYRSQVEMTTKALNQFETVLKLDPNNLHALWEAAELNRELAEFERAAELYRKLRTLNPNIRQVYESEADCWYRARDYRKAAEALEAGLRFHSGDTSYVIFLGNLYKQRGDIEKATSLLESELETNPNPELYHALAEVLLGAQEVDQVVTLLEGAIETHPRDVTLKLDLAKAYRQKRRVAEAGELLTEVLKARPDDLDANFEMANIQEIQGERDEAIALFQRLLEMTNPAVVHLRSLLETRLALLYEETGKKEEALKILGRVAERSPDDVEAQLRYFYALKGASRHEEGVRVTSALIEQHSDDAYVVIAHGQALAETSGLEEGTGYVIDRIEESSSPELLYIGASQILMSAEQFDEAEQLIKKGIANLPESSKLLFQHGAILERKKEYDAAEERFRDLLSEDPEQADILNYLGYMLAERGVKLDEALGFVKRAVELDPFNGAYLDSLGWVYYQRDELELAETYLLKALKINNSDPVIHEHLGDLYVKLGKKTEARGFYEKSLSYAENDQESKRVGEKLVKLQ